jgi:hypothetical protein
MEDLKQRVEDTNDLYEVAIANVGEILSDPHRTLYFEEKTQLSSALTAQSDLIKTLSEQNEKLREGLEILLERFLVWHSTDPEDGVAIRKAKKILEGK